MPAADRSHQVLERVEVLLNQGNTTAALALLRDVLAQRPSASPVRARYARLLFEIGRLGDAIPQLQRLHESQPDNAEHLCNLGYLLVLTGDLPEGLKRLEQAVSLAPGFAAALGNLGLTYNKLGQPDKGEFTLRQALAAAPDFAEAWTNLALSLFALGRLQEAEQAARKAVRLAPGVADMHCNLALILQESLALDDALAAYRRALSLAPGHLAAQSNYQMALQYRPGLSSRQLRQAAASVRYSPINAAGPVAHRANARTRIGFVSADFRRHPIGFFLPLPLSHIDRARFEIHCFSSSLNEDVFTARVREQADHWHSVGRMNDESLYRLIVAQEIDILIDLSGHTAGNRLACFAQRAARLQFSWLGYFASTGVAGLDAVLLGEEQAPAGAEAWYTEPLLRLQANQFCYQAPDYAPAVVEPPVLKNGYITFGSFNNAAKLNDELLRTWAGVLHDTPRSRLVLKWKGLNDPAVSTRLHRVFSSLGIASDRIVLRGNSPHPEMLAEYADIDIALDTFPFSGALTSCEALWMGLPIVTMAQLRPVSRQTAAILVAMGRESWVARNASDYRQIASTLALDVDSLATLRRRLRGECRQMAAEQAARLARSLERAATAAMDRLLETEQPKRLTGEAADDSSFVQELKND